MHRLDRLVPRLARMVCNRLRLVWLGMNGRFRMGYGFMLRRRLGGDVAFPFVFQSLGLGLRGKRFLVLLFGLCLFFSLVRIVGFGRRFLPGRRIVLIGKVFLILAGLGQGFGMLVLDLGDRQLELVELAAQHVFRRARLHAFELALDGSARLLVNLHPHLWSIIGQPIHGSPNDCCKICHQVFLMSIDLVPIKLS